MVQFEKNNDTSSSGETEGKKHDHKSVVASLMGMLLVMSTIVIYSPELYNMFCKATGYGGTTKRAETNNSAILDRQITIRFDATTASNLDWDFQPVKRQVDVHIGETVVAYYRVRNRSKNATTGTAVYNVTPEIAGSYFNKIECFCFTEQTLQPGEEMEMPLSFFVDPEIVKDPSGKYLNEIALSYVFYAKKNTVKSAGLSGRSSELR